jgi:prevent-host-death family protein
VDPVNIYEAKTRLSQLVDRAAAGEDVVIGRHGRPLVRLTRLEPARPGFRFGLLAGRVRIPDDFDEPLPDAVRAAFEGR